MGRWVMFTWTCRAFAWAGEKILPVLQASMFFMFQTSQRPETPKHRTSGLCHANGRPSSGARFYGFVTFLKLYNSIPIFPIVLTDTVSVTLGRDPAGLWSHLWWLLACLRSCLVHVVERQWKAWGKGVPRRGHREWHLGVDVGTERPGPV